MVLREMLVDDLDQVMKIENELFSQPWTKEGFFTYLTRKDAMFLVVEEKGEILAYCGLIMVLDEGDITNVAAVSYTHLDVYKRQTSYRLYPEVLSEICIPIL